MVVTLEVNTFNIGHFDSWVGCIDLCAFYYFALQPAYMLHIFCFLFLFCYTYFDYIKHYIKKEKKIFQNHSYFQKQLNRLNCHWKGTHDIPWKLLPLHQP